MAAISQTIFQTHFREWFVLYFDFHWRLFLRDNKSALVRPGHWRIYMYAELEGRLVEAILTYWPPDIPIINTLWPEQNGQYFADDIFKCFFERYFYFFIYIIWKFASCGSSENYFGLCDGLVSNSRQVISLTEPTMSHPSGNMKSPFSEKHGCS